MSMELSVLVPRERLPSMAEWQAILAELSIPIELDQTWKLDGDSGFMSCVLDGRETGCECYLDDSEKLAESLSKDGPRVKHFDAAVTFRWSSSSEECAVAFGAAAALAHHFGTLAVPDFDEPYDEARLLMEFRETMKSL